MNLDALVKATAEAVAQLSSLVEGVPRMVDAKLAAYQTGLKEAIAGVHIAMEAVQTEQAQLRSLVQVTTENLRSSFDQAGAELRQIIADNGEAAMKALGEQATKLETEVKCIGTTAQRALNQQVEALALQIAEVRTACDTTDLHFTVKSLQSGLAEAATVKLVETSVKAVVDEFTPAVAALGKRVDTVDEHLGLTQKEVASFQGAVGEVRMALSGTDARVTEVARSTAKLAEEGAGLADRVKATEEAAKTADAARAKSHLEAVELSGQWKAKHDEWVTSVGTALVTNAEAITEVREQVGGLLQEVPAIKASIAEAVAPLALETDLPKLEAELRGHIEAVKAGIVAVVDVLRDSTNDTLDAVQERLAGADTRITATQQSMGEKAGELRKDFHAVVDEAYKAMQAHVSGVVNHESVAVAQTIGEVRVLIEDLNKGLSAQAGAFVNLQGFVAQRADDLEELGKKVASLPAPAEPINVTELEVRLTAKLAELIPEQATMELPAPDIEVRFDGDDLVLDVSYGDKTATARKSIPVGFDYRGIYQPALKYIPGNIVTHKGSMWFAKGTPTGEPGKDITGWQLAVKCGRDGKDATPTRAYVGHETGRVYRETDFLRINNRLWQCTTKEATVVPEPGDVTSTREWNLIGGVH